MRFENAMAVMDELNAGAMLSATTYLDGARRVLTQLVSDPNVLKGRELARREGGYARTMLYGDERLSAYAFTWAPGSFTPIHDHHCTCCFGLVSGSLRDNWFRALDDGRAALTHTTVRQAGFVAALLPTGPNIHQMVNDGTEEAITIHIYGFDHRLHASSVDREYVLAAS